ncbi:4-hydroxy-tetrahydrodipicolinate synthase [Priestia megaterium]|uniref:4-hydroxy-tetrahydrodipicolinate synthase n=1 Tax=Priestia megaterium TaxID=1404 RepID=UPI000BF94144|nr:4-hydroxy-tetrahydrodipicolinate synthase [Priestia megaterium]MDC7722518.1 4-hydroxy-tetrahydrodipicolinate synthase [Priestia megaterium]PEU69303.1 4-hydroxy-tetrahydrodipicolinate synthase [Priestia megaterium]PFQ81165.1 4-hydroxy-tetrahydrodipicolinate synthase [Priestia megaterium]PGR10223.1 4-hydroxy-tetrahydrodipicolinate synthase [Priestia megaterium]UYP05893.1 4-hydroxy-tetrahydrodipicolinate synthase [Priestia megaterium]
MELKGIIPALLTPLTKEQTINERVLRQLTSDLIESGVHGIFALGTNGEFHLFTKEEKLKIAQIIIDEVKGRIPVIIGTGGNSTEEVIELSKQMEELGANALSVITPYFVTPTQEEVTVHFQRIAEETSLPVLLYNIPSKTGMSLDPETVATLADVPNIVGIKDSSGSFENIKNYIHVTKDKDFSVFAGTDSLILKTLEAGGVGAVAATANMVPDIVVSIYTNWLKGFNKEAEEAQKKLQPLRDTFQYGTLPSALKKAVELYGIPVGPPKLPVSELSGEGLEKVKEMVAGYKKQSAL